MLLSLVARFCYCVSHTTLPLANKHHCLIIMGSEGPICLIVTLIGMVCLLVIASIQIHDYNTYTSWTRGTCDFTRNRTDDTSSMTDAYSSYLDITTLASFPQKPDVLVRVRFPSGRLSLNQKSGTDMNSYLASLAGRPKVDCWADLDGKTLPYPAYTRNISSIGGWIFGLVLSVLFFASISCLILCLECREKK